MQKFKLEQFVIIVTGMAALSTLSFNCAPNLFQSSDYSYLNNSSTSVDAFGDVKNSPAVLQNTGQVFESMAALSGQSFNISAAQRAEYDARTGALSQTDKLSDISAPLQLGATSLAGEFCNGIITRESAAGAVRKFFNGVNFGVNLAGNSAATYSASTQVMAQTFWGRGLSAEEQQILSAYFNDFVASAGTANTQTRSLYLSTCAALLASFDAMTY